jgi:hypothetical protein
LEWVETEALQKATSGLSMKKEQRKKSGEGEITENHIERAHGR